MDAVLKDNIAKAEAAIKTTVSWATDQPQRQCVYEFFPNTPIDSKNPSGQWIARDPTQSSISPSANNHRSFEQISVMSWNIDFMIPFPRERMSIALDHLATLASDPTTQDSTASIIFLAECLQSDLKVITAHPWVRLNYIITDLDDQNWQNGFYGTTTLIDRRLTIVDCFRVHFSLTRMQRDGLFVDVNLGGGGHQDKPLRFCNTHLESLALEPPYRPPQLATCAQWMKRPEIHASVLAGDLNAIQPFDRTLHSTNGLRDAFLEFGGEEEDAQGHTWGQQAATALREKFGTSRMDKVLYHGPLVLQLFETFGQGVELVDAEQRDKVMQLGFDRPWITDHFGVKAVFGVGGSAQTML